MQRTDTWLLQLSGINFTHLSCIEVTNSTPQKDIHQLNQELQKQGFKTLSSDNDFKSSLTCNSCGLTLSHQNSAKAMWLVKRHANCDSHKVKVGWYLSAKNKVLASNLSITQLIAK